MTVSKGELFLTVLIGTIAAAMARPVVYKFTGIAL